MAGRLPFLTWVTWPEGQPKPPHLPPRCKVAVRGDEIVAFVWPDENRKWFGARHWELYYRGDERPAGMQFHATAADAKAYAEDALAALDRERRRRGD